MKTRYVFKDDRFRGIVLIVGAVFLLAFADALVKFLSDRLSLWQLFLLASLMSLPVLAVRLVALGGMRALRPMAMRWVVLRSLLLVTMWLLFYAALPWVPLAVAAVGIYTTPLFIAGLASLGGNEQLTRWHWLAVLLGFLGVLVALRPGGELFSIVMLLPVAAALCYAQAMVLTRRYCANERPELLAFGLNLGFLILGLVGSGVTALVGHVDAGSGFLSPAWHPLGIIELLLIALYALLMVFVNTAVATAYQVAPSTVVGTFDYAYLVFAACWGYLLFDELPDMWTVVGMAMILVSGWIVVQRPRENP